MNYSRLKHYHSMFFFYDPEIWRPVLGYEGLYEVSNYGRVKSLTRITLGKHGRYCTFYGRMLKQRPSTTCKYLITDLCKNGKRIHFLTHILVAKAFLGDYQGLEVNHKNGNIYDNHLSNLEVISHYENIQHSIQMGLKRDCGEKHVHAKITNNQAQLIRKRVANGEKQKDIAIELGVSKQLINSVVLNKTYIK